jgi:23S rRNA pseudouridine2604 synthase
MQITKYIASNTNYSRRQAEKLIRDKKITINKEVAYLGQIVTAHDKIYLNNKLIIAKKKDLILIMLNKPVDYTCTKKTFANEKNIYQLLPRKYQNFNIIGRLDKDSQGLLLLCNQGDVINQLSHPRYQHQKKYQVEVDRELTKKEIEIIKKGVEDKNETLNVKDIRGGNKYYLITLTEGKNRHIRRIFNHFKISIKQLNRIAINNLSLGVLKIGGYRELNKEDLKDLYFSEKWLK